MSELLLVFIASALVNNSLLTQLLGLDRALEHEQLDRCYAHGLATTVVMTVASAGMWCVQRYVLTPLSLDLFVGFAAVATVAAVTGASAAGLSRAFPALHGTLHGQWWLIAANAAVLSAAVSAAQTRTGFGAALIGGLGAGIGFALVLAMLTALRLRLATNEMPQAFRGLPIALISAGLMALAFMGFSGIARS